MASTVSGQNVRINTGNGNTENTTTSIQGSQLLASNNIAITTGDLNISASKNTATSSSEAEHGHVTAQMTVYGAAGGASVNGSFDRSQNRSRETTYNNSILLADSIDPTTSGDTTLRGATVRAESELNADIGGNLTVESVQDRSSSSNSSAGISGGYSLGGDGETNQGNAFTRNLQSAGNLGTLSGINVGANTGNGMSDSRQTVLTSLTSGGVANINVQNHTQITGALIGTTDQNGNDLNQLNLSINFNMQPVNTGSGQTFSDPTAAAQAAAQPTVATGANGEELKPGTIMVGGTVLEQNGALTEAGAAEDSPLVGINRDTTDTNKELWNSDYSQDVDVTIDNRLFTDEGQKKIAEDFERSERLGQALVEVASEASVELRDTLNHIDGVQKDLDVQKAFALANDGQGIEAFQGDGTSVEEKQAAIETYARIYADTYDIGIEAATIIATSKIIGGSTYTVDSRSSIAINDNAQDNALDYARTMGHEVTHARIRQQQTRNRGSDTLNDEYADIMGDYSADGMAFSSSTYNDIQLDTHQKTNTKTRRGNDDAVLAGNNQQWNANIQRAKNGEGVMDYRQLYQSEARLMDAVKQRVNENPNLNDEQKALMHLQLNAVACAEIQCAEGVPPSDAHYDQLSKLEAMGNTLKANGVTLDVMLGEMPEGAFEYDAEDTAQDFLTRNDKETTKAKGAVDATLGAASTGLGAVVTVTSAAACPATGVSCILTGVSATGTALAAKQTYDGITAMFGDYTSVEGQRVLDSFSEATHQGDRNLVADSLFNTGLWIAEAFVIKKASNLIPDGVLKDTGDIKPNMRAGDGDDSGLDTPLVDGGRTVNEKPVKQNTNSEQQRNQEASQKVNTITAPIDFDGHILSAEIKSGGKVVGGHSTATGDIRVIPGTATTPNAQGVYSAKIEVADPNNPGMYLAKTNNNGESTMFPDSWSADRIKVEVDHAFKNKVVTGNKWTGKTPSGVTVEGYLAPKTTVYPKL